MAGGDVGVSVDEPVNGNDILAASEASKKIDNPWGRLLKQRIYKPFLIMEVLITFFSQFSGMDVVMFYAPFLFKRLGFGSRTALALAVLISGADIINQSYAILVLLFFCDIVTGFAWSWGPLEWLVIIFPLEVRSALQRINVCVNMFFIFVVAQILLNMLEILKYGLFFIFGSFGGIIIMSIFVYLILPETKGIPIEEMSKVWKNHWFWKRFTDGDDYELEEKKVQ